LRVVVATKNRGKATEFSRLLRGRFRVEPLPETLQLPEETGQTFAANAELKARAVYAELGGEIAVLADDSGLEVAALGGAPGVHSARFAGPGARDEDNYGKLLTDLGDSADRSARFVCHLVLLLPPGAGGAAGDMVRAVGVLEGEITEEPRGEGGFGYDPVFRPGGRQATLAEVPGSEKDTLSHRGAAVRALLRELAERGVPAAPRSDEPTDG
jgi:XTP/dITP diphosphohydrolase